MVLFLYISYISEINNNKKLEIKNFFLYFYFNQLNRRRGARINLIEELKQNNTTTRIKEIARKQIKNLKKKFFYMKEANWY